MSEEEEKEKAVQQIEILFARAFRSHFRRSTHEQRLRGETFCCSVCSRAEYDNEGHAKEFKWLAVNSQARVDCEFPHTVCLQDAHHVSDIPNTEHIRAAVEREWDHIKDVHSLS
jgi:hypothetical protein